MRGITATLSRELRAYFFSPLAYVVLTLFLVVNGYIFWLIVSYLNHPNAGIGAPLQLFFGETVFFWLVLLFITPVLTMRMLSEERRSGTIEVLMTSPVTEGQVVTGKFLAAFLFYVFLWLPTLVYVFVLQAYSKVDWGPVAAGYLGVLGIGAVFLAAGTFASALTKNQLIATLLTFVVLFGLFTVDLLENLFNNATAKHVLGYFDLWQHMDEFSKGIVDTGRLVYYLSAVVLFLFFSARALEAKKWR